MLGKEMVDVDDSTKVYKIGGVSKKVRYNDFWPNYSDRYVDVYKRQGFGRYGANFHILPLP